MQNAQWALAWNIISIATAKIIAEAEWTSCRVIEPLHNGTALRYALNVQRPSRAKPAAAPVRPSEPPMLIRDRGGAPAWTLDQAVHSAHRWQAVLAIAMVVYKLRVA